MRPELATSMSVQDFRDYYWLKEELQIFCRENGISASGSKMEISDRIEGFLRTGLPENPLRKTKVKRNTKLNADLSLDTVITENHRCSQEVRAFFKTIIPKFHFSTYIQNFFKNNIGKTYRDAVEAWHKEEERKKTPRYRKAIAPQFEYNQFIRDFFADPVNRGKSREAALEAWKEVKKRPGSRKYKPDPPGFTYGKSGV